MSFHISVVFLDQPFPQIFPQDKGLQNIILSNLLIYLTYKVSFKIYLKQYISLSHPQNDKWQDLRIYLENIWMRLNFFNVYLYLQLYIK